MVRKHFKDVRSVTCVHNGDLDNGLPESTPYFCKITHSEANVEGKYFQKTTNFSNLQRVTIATKPHSEEEGATLELPKRSFENILLIPWSPLHCEYDKDREELECKEEYEAG